MAGGHAQRHSLGAVAHRAADTSAVMALHFPSRDQGATAASTSSIVWIGEFAGTRQPPSMMTYGSVNSISFARSGSRATKAMSQRSLAASAVTLPAAS